jgi:hypothetical protein
MVASDELCDQKILDFGNGLGFDHIPEQCLSKLYLSENNTMRIDFFRNFSVIALDKAIAIYSGKTKSHFLAGEKTLLEKITAIRPRWDLKKLFVLQGEVGEIHVFNYEFLGNTRAPQMLKHDDFIGANDLDIDSINKEIFVLNSNQNKLGIYHSEKNSRARGELAKVEKLREWLELPPQTISFALLSENQMVILTATGELSLYHTKTFKKIKEIERITEVQFPLALDFDSQKNELYLLKGDQIIQVWGL